MVVAVRQWRDYRLDISRSLVALAVIAVHFPLVNAQAPSRPAPRVPLQNNKLTIKACKPQLRLLQRYNNQSILFDFISRQFSVDRVVSACALRVTSSRRASQSCRASKFKRCAVSACHESPPHRSFLQADIFNFNY